MEYCRNLVATLKAKWNPLAVKQDDGLDIETDQEDDSMDDTVNEHQVRFNPDVRLKEYPEKGIRAFTKRGKRTHLPAYRQKGKEPRNSMVVTVASM
jgi:hypothetical protein